MTRKALTIKNVSKRFDDDHYSGFTSLFNKKKFTAINNVTLEVNKGEVFGILGSNGCGKSTLIRMISTLLTPDKGTIKVFGRDVYKQRNAVKKMINRVSVEASFFKRLSPYENLVYAGRLYGLDKEYIVKRSREILESIGFDLKKFDSPIEKFSRGMQQKVAIARGFLSTPLLLLLDEPTTGLDPKSKIDVQNFIRKIRKEHDVTIILTSHDMDEVERLCDRILVLDKGKVLAQGTADELKRIVLTNEKYEIVTEEIKNLRTMLESVDNVFNVVTTKNSVIFESKEKVLPHVIKKLNGFAFTQIINIKPTLEDVFIYLTGRSLEDEDE